MDMINLLPTRQKEDLLQEKNLKLFLILGILILFFFVSFSLILFSIKIQVQTEAEVQKNYFNQKDTAIKNSEIQKWEDKINGYNSSISSLDSFYQNHRDLTDVLEKIFQTIPEGIILDTLSFDSSALKGEKYLAQVSLSGNSSTQDILFDFKKNLEKEEGFKEVYFPLSLWIETTDIDFSINFKILK